jgi:hypothetical protein
LFNEEKQVVTEIARAIGQRTRSLGEHLNEIKEFFYRKLPPLLWLSRTVNDYIGRRTLDKFTT